MIYHVPIYRSGVVEISHLQKNEIIFTFVNRVFGTFFMERPNIFFCNLYASRTMPYCKTYIHQELGNFQKRSQKAVTVCCPDLCPEWRPHLGTSRRVAQVKLADREWPGLGGSKWGPWQGLPPCHCAHREQSLLCQLWQVHVWRLEGGQQNLHPQHECELHFILAI